VSKIVDDMHADGTLSSLSEKWYKTDLTTQSASG
jgi:ABC-type amino acid transport substrate-binding protein